MRIINFYMRIALVLLDTADSFYDFLTTPLEVAGTDYIVAELMFGGGLIFALTYIFVSWVIDLLP